MTKCLHKFGQDKGYCAEIIEVGYYSYWCSRLGIEFNLQVDQHPKGISCFNGWQDYFNPLFKTVSSSSIACSLNRHTVSALRQSWLPVRRKALKLLHPDYLFFTFDMNEVATRFACKANATFINVGAEINQHFNYIYSLNSFVMSKVHERMRELQTPGKYCVFHIRRGDKIKEASYADIQKYISGYKTLYPHLDMPIYVMTDSIGVIKSCLAKLPSDIIFGHSTLPCNQAGYDQVVFNTLSPADRYSKTLEIIIDLEIARGSEAFWGTQTSNIFGLMNHLHPLASGSLINVDQLDLLP
jgi:hypothetical protein